MGRDTAMAETKNYLQGIYQHTSENLLMKVFVF